MLARALYKEYLEPRFERRKAERAALREREAADALIQRFEKLSPSERARIAEILLNAKAKKTETSLPTHDLITPDCLVTLKEVRRKSRGAALRRWMQAEPTLLENLQTPVKAKVLIDAGLTLADVRWEVTKRGLAEHSCS